MHRTLPRVTISGPVYLVTGGEEEDTFWVGFCGGVVALWEWFEVLCASIWTPLATWHKRFQPISVFRVLLTLCEKMCKTGACDEKDTLGSLSKFSYQDFDIKDKQKI